MTQIYFFYINRKTQPIIMKIVLEVKNIVSNVILIDFWKKKNFDRHSSKVPLGSFLVAWSDVSKVTLARFRYKIFRSQWNLNSTRVKLLGLNSSEII
jgi:hypothetical protein